MAKAFNLLLLLLSSRSADALPDLPQNLCDYDTIYDKIKTGNTVDVTLTVRYRDCPSNKGNQPCGIVVNETFTPGPHLDGVRSHIITVNDQTPGPPIRAMLGDKVRVKVINHLGEPTTLHFHGMTQFRTPSQDGDEGISNCPIPVGESYTYEFIAHPAGSSFYHSHVNSQRISGMQGAFIVEDPTDKQEAATEHSVFFHDWYHQSADENFNFWGQNTPGACITFGGPRFSGALNPRKEPSYVGAVVADGIVFQSFLVNGKGNYNYTATQIPGILDSGLGNATYDFQSCPGQQSTPPRCELCLDPSDWSSYECTESSGDTECGSIEVFEVSTKASSSKLRFINAGALFAAQICVDGHGMTIVAADGSKVVPYETECIIVYPAERYDVTIDTTNTKAGDYWIRFTTLEQKIAAEISKGNDFGPDTETFPHQGLALLRVSDKSEVSLSSNIADLPDRLPNNPGVAHPADYPYLRDHSPIACSDSVTVNCGAEYWKTSVTMNCATTAARDDPDRCKSTFELKAAVSSSDDAALCGDADKIMAHQAEATRKYTTALSFLPDQVPRYQGMSLNSRMEILPEEDWGFPFINPDEPAEWEAREPISFVNPPTPPLSLDAETRNEIYSERKVFRELDPEDLLGPNNSDAKKRYPPNFARGVMGTNAVSVNYGDVVRIFLSCTEPYGPGCAMPHPMHLHGSKMAVLYVGAWDEKYDESKFNTENPVYRDTVVAHTDSWVVVQFVANNPGVWRFHCHVNIHHRSGMAMLFDVGGDESVEAVRAITEKDNLCPTIETTEGNASSATVYNLSFMVSLGLAAVLVAL